MGDQKTFFPLLDRAKGRPKMASAVAAPLLVDFAGVLVGAFSVGLAAALEEVAFAGAGALALAEVEALLAEDFLPLTVIFLLLLTQSCDPVLHQCPIWTIPRSSDLWRRPRKLAKPGSKAIKKMH